MGPAEVPPMLLTTVDVSLYLVPHVHAKEDKSAYQSGESKHATCSIFCGFSCSHEV